MCSKVVASSTGFLEDERVLSSRLSSCAVILNLEKLKPHIDETIIIVSMGPASANRGMFDTVQYRKKPLFLGY